MYIKKSYKKSIFSLFLLLVVVCMFLNSISFVIKASATNGKAVDGTDISSNEDLGYYMGISLGSIKGFVDGATNDYDLVRNADPFTRKEQDITLIIVFADVVDEKSNNRPVLITQATYSEFPASFQLWDKSFTFNRNDELKINLRKEYYEHFEKNGGKFSRFKIKMLYKNCAVNMYTKSLGIFDNRDVNSIFNSNVRLFRAPVDPNDGLPGGDGLAPPNDDIGDDIIDFVKKNSWAKVLLIALGGIFAIGLLRLIFKK